MKIVWVGFVAMWLLVSGVCRAELSFAPIFNDGAVLQCEMPVNIWGTADSGEAVTVSFAGQEKMAVTDSKGNWKVQLDAMPASSEPRKLTVVSSIGPKRSADNFPKGNSDKGAVHQKSKIGNVVVGEVWLASGQSNMAFALGRSDEGAKWLRRSIPGIRFIRVPRKLGLPVEREYTIADLAWKSFAPEQNAGMSAVCFYFSEQVQKATGRSVGILQSAAGGTPCEAWTSLWALDSQPELRHLADTIRKGVASGRPKAECVAEVEVNHQWSLANREWEKTLEGTAPVRPRRVDQGNPWFDRAPTVLYENMIAPLLLYTARGVIWYQGEGNTGRSAEYRVLFPAMIKGWRKAANRPGWPFLFVQLPAYGHPNLDWSRLRAAQTFTRETVPNTGMALAIDVGEEHDIHPTNKQPVGERLARLALNQVYGQDVIARGPVFHSIEVREADASRRQRPEGERQPLEKDGSTMRVVFQGSEKGLETRDGKPEVPGFELAGTDGTFHSAQARIVSKDTVELICAVIGKPVSVRYGWANWVEPPVTLQNSAGLPAEPFSR